MITKVYISPDHEGLVIEHDEGDGGLFMLEPDVLELTELDVFDGEGWTILLPDDA